MSQFLLNLKEKALSTIRKLTANGCMVGTSESVTGGQIAAALTKIDGCSNVLFATQVIYSPLGKSVFCNIPLDKVMEIGTVSEEMVDRLVDCMHEKFLFSLNKNANSIPNESFPRFFISLAVVGVAGGSVEGKGKGHVVIGLETRRIKKDGSFSGEKIRASSKTYKLEGNRDEIIYQATSLALDLIYEEKFG